MKAGAFFREPAHFELLARSVLPGLAQTAERGSMQLWSAGCASGEDAWSLAMIIEEARLPSHLDVTVLATDGDARALARASDAVYREDELQGVSAERRQRHFVRGVGARAGLWRIVAPLRDRVEFAELDLHAPWPEHGPFDVVMCHGALGDLDAQSAVHLVCRFADVLAPGGVMLLGPVRSLTAEVPRLEPYGRAAYKKLA